jgi:hypothetical protein
VGLPAGGTSLTISGIGFGAFVQDTSVVNWGASTITSLCGTSGTTNCIVKWSANGVSIKTPSGTAGTSKTVRINSGAAATSVLSSFYYGPVVTALKPQAGAAAGGTSLTIYGTGLGSFTQGTSTVNWGATAITDMCTTSGQLGCITKWSDKSVTISTPAGTGSKTVKVNSGGALTMPDTTFYYGAVVTGMKPQLGPTTGGASATITGIGFGTFTQGTSTVNWGATAITDMCSVSVTKGCIGKCGATSVSVLVPDSPDASTPQKVAVNVNGSPAISTLDASYYYGSVVTGLKPQ